MINLKAKIAFRGKYIIKHWKEDTLLNEFSISNIITNSGLDLIHTSATTGNPAMWVHVGTGNTTPAITDTSLEALVATVASDDRDLLGQVIPTTQDAGWPFRYRWYYQFPVGTFDTVTLREIGVSPTESSDLFSRTLFADTDGNPIELTVLSDEYLDVTFTLYSYVDLTDSSAVINVDGTDITVTGRAASLNDTACRGLEGCRVNIFAAPSNNYTSGITPTTVCVVSTNTLYDQTDNAVCDAREFNPVEYEASSVVADAYTPGSHQLTGYARFNQLRGNLPGGEIGSVLVQHTFGIWQFAFSPKLPKTQDIIYHFYFSLTWDRYTP